MKNTGILILKVISFLLIAIVSLVLFFIMTPLSYLWVKIENSQIAPFTTDFLPGAVRSQLYLIRSFVDN